MNNFLVSVIVPVHNAEQFLCECIESILRQTYSNLQLILVDDCSDDGSLEICRKYKEKDKRVKVLKLRKNEGVSTARNCGIKNSDGRFTCFVDADDLIDVGFIKYMTEVILREKVPVVYGRFKYIQKGKIIPRKVRIKEGSYRTSDVSKYLIDDGTLTGILFGSACGAIYDMELIRGFTISFDEKLRKNEDGLFNLDLLEKIDRFYVVDYDGYTYRQWKEHLNIPVFEPDIELENASDAIRLRHSKVVDFSLQMKRREVSIVFWNAIRIGQCKGSLMENCRRLYNYITSSSLTDNYHLLRRDAIGFFKQVLVNMLYNKQIVRFCVLMRYVYPLLKQFR